MIGIGNDFFVDLVNVKRYVYRAIFCLKSKTKVVHSCLSLHTSYIGPQKRISRHLLLLSPCFCSIHFYLCLQPWFPSPLVPTPPSLLLVCSSNLYPPTCRLLMFYVSPPQWSRITKNPDVSTEPLACPFARSLAPLTHSLAPHLLCYCAPLRSLTHSLLSSWESEWYDAFFFYIFFCSGP